MIKSIDGFEIDFNFGCRVLAPEIIKDLYEIYLTSDDVLVDNFVFRPQTLSENPENRISQSNKKFFLNYKLSFYKNKELSFEYNLDLKDKNVLIIINGGALGDNIAWMGVCNQFKKKHNCNLYISVHTKYSDLFKNQYKDIKFLDNLDNCKTEFFASYILQTNLTQDYAPIQSSICGIIDYAKHILGIDFNSDHEKPKLDFSKPRQIKEKYVCIGIKSPHIKKMWIYPNGWETVVNYLKSIGYRVICIDENRAEKFEEVEYTSYMPKNSEDFTGSLPLQERVDLLKDADFFIGLNSGLSWLAWACNIPVVMISGFSYTKTEFYTPYRVTSFIGCSCCFNSSISEEININDAKKIICRNTVKNRPDSFLQCQKNISPKMVIDVINRIPCVKNV